MGYIVVMTNATQTTSSRPALKIRFHAPIVSLNDNDGSHEPTVSCSGRTILVRNVKRADWTKFGQRHTGETMVGHHVDVVPGKSIRLHGVETNHVNGPVSYDRTFVVGDVVEYDSYNMSYTGRILSIGRSTVTVDASCTGDKKCRLDLANFSWRNRLLNLVKIYRENSEWMD